LINVYLGILKNIHLKIKDFLLLFKGFALTD